MLKSIHLINFQSHAESFVAFHPGVNIVIGSNAAGKTALISRALKWVTKNRPLGNKVCTRGRAVSTSVLTEWDNGIVNKWRRDKETGYCVNGLDLATIGNGPPPEEALKVLNLSDNCLQEQHAPVYMLGASPGDVSKLLNKLIGAEIFDLLRMILNKELTGKNKELELAEKNLEATKAKIDKLEGVHKLECRINSAMDMEKSIADRNNTICALEEFKRIKEKITKNRRIAILRPRIEKFERDYQRHLESSDMLSRLTEMAQNLKSIQNRVQSKDMIQSLKFRANRAEEAIIQLHEDLKKQGRLLAHVLDIKYTNEKIAVGKSKLIELNAKYEEIMPGICPLCGKQVKQ